MNSFWHDLETYTRGLQSAPNAWGQHIIEGMQSHSFLRLIRERHGAEQIDKALDAYYSSVERTKPCDFGLFDQSARDQSDLVDLAKKGAKQ